MQKSTASSTPSFMGNAMRLPSINTVEEFSGFLGIPKEVLTKLIFTSDLRYKEFKIKKKSGNGYRLISAPSRTLKGIQRWIDVFILRKVPISEAGTAFHIGASIVKNASVHVGKKWVYNIDLKDFFPSITEKRVYGLFRGLGYPTAISSAFAKLSTYKKRLPQGAPSSPTIANIICKRLDSRLLAYCNKNSISYTRYADDLTFSSEVAQYPPARTIHAIIQSEGFEANSRKERIIRSSCRQIVTGLVVNKKVSVLRGEKKRIRAICFQEKCKRSTKPNIFLQGRIAFVGMVEPDSSVVKSYFAYFKKKSMTEDA